MRAYRALTTALFKSQLREPVGFFFVMVFSSVVLIVLGAIFGNDPQPQFGMRGFVDKLLPGLAIISITVVGIMLVPQNQLMMRASGALARMQITPLRPGTFVLADLTVFSLLGLVGAAPIMIIGILVFGVEPPTNPLLVALALVLGMTTMLAIGYTLAAIYPSVTAAAGIGNGLMIVLMMTSGAFIPTEVLSENVLRMMKLSPVRHMTLLVDAAWSGGAWPWASMVVLVLLTIVFALLGIRLFRWGQRR